MYCGNPRCGICKYACSVQTEQLEWEVIRIGEDGGEATLELRRPDSKPAGGGSATVSAIEVSGTLDPWSPDYVRTKKLEGQSTHTFTKNPPLSALNGPSPAVSATFAGIPWVPSQTVAKTAGGGVSRTNTHAINKVGYTLQVETDDFKKGINDLVLDIACYLTSQKAGGGLISKAYAVDPIRFLATVSSILLEPMIGEQYADKVFVGIAYGTYTNGSNGSSLPAPQNFKLTLDTGNLTATGTGCTCKKCKQVNEYAAPNQPDGTYVCFSCRP